MCFEEEAGICRRRALAYLGQPEAKLLLSMAREFERLALEYPNVATSALQGIIATDKRPALVQ